MTSILPHKKHLDFDALKDILEQANDKENAVRDIVKSIRTNELLENVFMGQLLRTIDDEKVEGLIRDAVFRNRHVKEWVCSKRMWTSKSSVANFAR